MQQLNLTTVIEEGLFLLHVSFVFVEGGHIVYFEGMFV
jgi:hypothetical protein